MHNFAGVGEKIAFCFDDPRQPVEDHKKASTVSVLFLLRQELLSTAGYEPLKETEEVASQCGARCRLFATMGLCFTAMDLLAKFARGDAESVGARFRGFLKDPDLGGQDPDSADLFYAARNSLIHAFGTPDEDAAKKLGLKHVGFVHGQKVSLGGFTGQMLVSRQSDTAILHVNGILSETIQLISKTEELLHGAGTEEARKVFETVFDRYGTLEMP